MHTPSIPVDDERATSLHSGPLAEAFPAAKFMREVVAVGLRDSDRNRADGVKPVRRTAAMKTVAIGIAKALHVLFDPIFVLGHGFASLRMIRTRPTPATSFSL